MPLGHILRRAGRSAAELQLPKNRSVSMVQQHQPYQISNLHLCKLHDAPLASLHTSGQAPVTQLVQEVTDVQKHWCAAVLWSPSGQVTQL